MCIVLMYVMSLLCMFSCESMCSDGKKKSASKQQQQLSVGEVVDQFLYGGAATIHDVAAAQLREKGAGKINMGAKDKGKIGK